VPEQRLDQHLQRFYAGKRPSEDCLERLAALTEPPQTPAPKDTAPTAGRRPAKARLLGIAATLLLIILGSGALLLQHNRHHADLTWLVAKEIAVNHNKRLAIEFPASDYRALNRMMSKLDFSSVGSSRLPVEQYQLLGGRYCSLQGQLALQLKLKDRAGNRYTLYQTPLSKTLAVIPEGEQLIDGLRITLWREGGLLLGLAGPQGGEKEERKEEKDSENQ